MCKWIDTIVYYRMCEGNSKQFIGTRHVIEARAYVGNTVGVVGIL